MQGLLFSLHTVLVQYARTLCGLRRLVVLEATAIKGCCESAALRRFFVPCLAALIALFSGFRKVIMFCISFFLEIFSLKTTDVTNNLTLVYVYGTYSPYPFINDSLFILQLSMASYLEK